MQITSYLSEIIVKLQSKLFLSETTAKLTRKDIHCCMASPTHSKDCYYSQALKHFFCSEIIFEMDTIKCTNKNIPNVKTKCCITVQSTAKLMNAMYLLRNYLLSLRVGSSSSLPHLPLDDAITTRPPRLVISPRRRSHARK